MPTYDYECPDCQHRFEAFHSMSADPIKECPNCDLENVRRLIGAGAGLIFKGSGFYITDYRSKSYQDGKKKAEGGSEGGSEGGKKEGKESSAPKSSEGPAKPPSSGTTKTES